MKQCNLSDETKEVLRQVLIELEMQRNRANEKCDYPPSDYPYRAGQAIVAEKLGFEHRAEWQTKEFLNIKIKL